MKHETGPSNTIHLPLFREQMSSIYQTTNKLGTCYVRWTHFNTSLAFFFFLTNPDVFPALRFSVHCTLPADRPAMPMCTARSRVLESIFKYPQAVSTSTTNWSRRDPAVSKSPMARFSLPSIEYRYSFAHHYWWVGGGTGGCAAHTFLLWITSLNIAAFPKPFLRTIAKPNVTRARSLRTITGCVTPCTAPVCG